MAEAQQLLKQLQSLVPKLQAMMVGKQPAWEGARLFQAHVALLWAVNCLDQCTTQGPARKGLLLAPIISSLPQVQTCIIPSVVTHRILTTLSPTCYLAS